MRFRVLCAFVVLSWSTVMFGQATGATAWDVFAGGSYNRITNATQGQDENLYGWDMSVSERPYSLRRWIGGTIEASGAYHSTSSKTSTISSTTTYSLYTIMAGPVVAAPSGRVRPFAHALLGEAIQNASASVTTQSIAAMITPKASGTANTESSSTSSNNFAFAVGGGADISINRTWGIRAQGDWLQVSQTATTAFNFVRASVGIVARF